MPNPRFAIAAACAALLAAGCAGGGDAPEGDEGRVWDALLSRQQDSIGVLERTMRNRTGTYERLSEEKDTLIQTLHTAMLLFNELSEVEREIVGEETQPEGEALQPWDNRIRSQLERLRARYQQLGEELSRTEQRLEELRGRDATLRASLAEALSTAANLREDNARKQQLIEQLQLRVEVLTGERDAAVALSVARADTIQNLEERNNTVYWVAGTETELKALGLVESVGGRHMIFTRVGETLAPGRALDPAHFQSIDRRRTQVIDVPEGAEYEIVTPQNMQYADRTTVRGEGKRWFVRGELRVADARFWEPSPFLILVRR